MVRAGLWYGILKWRLWRQQQRCPTHNSSEHLPGCIQDQAFPHSLSLVKLQEERLITLALIPLSFLWSSLSAPEHLVSTNCCLELRIILSVVPILKHGELYLYATDTGEHCFSPVKPVRLWWFIQLEPKQMSWKIFFTPVDDLTYSISF